MMGKEEANQDKLFYHNICLEKRIRSNHVLRHIKEKIDFSFCYEAVAGTYGSKVNVSIPPPIILKLMLLLVFYNVRSERELMDTLPERLDWLWFLGFDLDSNIPNHSILSKARKRWGTSIFEEFFQRIIMQCSEGGLIDGRKIFVDASFIDANASKNSVVDKAYLEKQFGEKYRELERRLEDNAYSNPRGSVNARCVSKTDPDAAIVRHTAGKSKPRHLTHRAVEEKSEIITAVKVTRGDENEAHHLESLLLGHRLNTSFEARTVVADKKYGTVANYLKCHELDVNAHMSDLKAAQKFRFKDKFSDTDFKYSIDSDTYTCPGGKTLRRKSLHIKRQSIDYSAGKTNCNTCELRKMCTDNKSGRTIKRHLKQDALNEMRQRAKGYKATKDIKTRQHLMERSFARATRYGFDRARWRGLWRVKIQELLVCAVQNIQVLINRSLKTPIKVCALAFSIETNHAIGSSLARNGLRTSIFIGIILL